MCVGVLRRSEVGLRMRNVVVRVRGKKQSCQGANGRDHGTGCSGGDLFAATTSTTGKAREGKAIATTLVRPAKDDLPELAPEDCGHAPDGHSQLHAETHAAPPAQEGARIDDCR